MANKRVNETNRFDASTAMHTERQNANDEDSNRKQEKQNTHEIRVHTDKTAVRRQFAYTKVTILYYLLKQTRKFHGKCIKRYLALADSDKIFAHTIKCERIFTKDTKQLMRFHF